MEYTGYSFHVLVLSIETQDILHVKVGSVKDVFRRTWCHGLVKRDLEGDHWVVTVTPGHLLKQGSCVTYPPWGMHLSL